jgi:hypothetical protein
VQKDAMLSKITHFASTFAALLSDSNTVIDVDSRFAKIQDAMMSCLLEHLSDEPVLPNVYFDVSKAMEVQTLWYLRSDLFANIAEHCGEQAAQDKLHVITEMFRGIIPSNQMPNRRRVER